ncbi:MAG TPA: zf-HC2 domain-containing protein [Myxococcales bacterium]|nr:zf-HC2 domain-containing protein [Myxococcales bacterium]
MTHAESQELLLDLACGELDTGRAAEVEEHLAGCAECRAEKAALEEARRLSAPLREQEEPPAGFDDRILEAARAEARLQHDGNVGQVIEVSGNVRPLGLEAARIDAHAPVKARPSPRARPKWMIRAALGGSVAAAAALTLAVSTMLDARRTAEKVSQERNEDYRIRVHAAAPDAVDSAMHDAEARREGDRAGAKERAPAPTAQQPPPPPPQVALKKKQQEPVVQYAPLGKVPAKGEVARSDKDEKLAAAEEAKPQGAAAPQAVAVGSASNDGLAAGGSGAVQRRQRAASAPVSGTAAAPQESQVARGAPAQTAKTLAAAPPGAADIEARAQQARHAGDYALAASLYQKAAGARQREGDGGSAAWNLAHAVECLAAVGSFDEARQVREELARLHPTETTAIAAAQRALREVDAPGATPSAKPK